MKCFLDSNVIISAGIFPNSLPAAAIVKAISPPNTAAVSDYSLDETARVINKKFPGKVGDFEQFLSRALFTVELVITTADDIEEESKVRDVKDRPILRAAVAANCDVLITGDKDLLESGATQPLIVTPAQFLQMSEVLT